MQHWTRTRTRSNPFEPVPVQNAFKRRSKGVHYPFATRSLGVKMLPFGGPKNTKIMSQNKGWKIHFLGWRLKSCWFMLVHVCSCWHLCWIWRSQVVAQREAMEIYEQFEHQSLHGSKKVSYNDVLVSKIWTVWTKRSRLVLKKPYLLQALIAQDFAQTGLSGVVHQKSVERDVWRPEPGNFPS